MNIKIGSNKITSQKEAIINLIASIGIPFDSNFTHFEDFNGDVSEILEMALSKINRTKLHNMNAVPVLNYLSSNHKYYCNTALPTISLSFWNAIQNCKDSYFILELCSSLFDEFSTALNAHIAEEETIFNQLKLQPDSRASAIEFFSTEHHNESSALESIINILNTLQPEKTLAPQNILNIQLQNLVNELKIHTFVEERILLPILLNN